MATDIIIRKQKIKMITNSEQTALQVRRQLNDHLQYDLIKVFETAFPDTLAADEYVTINNIRIDLGSLTTDVFELHFIPLVASKLKAELQKTFANYPLSSGQAEKPETPNKESIESTSSFSKKALEKNALLYFLEYGIYPWWYKKEQQQTPAELLNNLQESALEALLLQIISIANYRSTRVFGIIIERLFIYLAEAQYKSWVRQIVNLCNSSILKNNIDSLLNYEEELERSLFISKQEFYKTLFRLITERNTDSHADIAQTFISRLHESKILSNDEGTSIQNPNKPFPRKEFVSSEIEEEGIYINNSGLILLHPFLVAFFDHLGLLNAQQQFVSLTAQQKAAVLLFYLQSNNEVYEEWNMAFNKILCGLAVDEILPAGVYIEEKEKEECKELLQNVADHWQALKGASAEALQNTFLLREGKMTRKETHWLLQVERTGVDILLEKLPWSFGTVKLPWLQQLIHTEW